jgi:hypothetical protein
VIGAHALAGGGALASSVLAGGETVPPLPDCTEPPEPLDDDGAPPDTGVSDVPPPDEPLGAEPAGPEGSLPEGVLPLLGGAAALLHAAHATSATTVANAKG